MPPSSVNFTIRKSLIRSIRCYANKITHTTHVRAAQQTTAVRAAAAVLAHLTATLLTNSTQADRTADNC